METIWFALVALMLVGYVVLDGFDLGAGALHLFAARTDGERRLILQSIGPVWDGNEVWLLAAGGTLFYAFPLLYASSFSGFYLALNIVLWLLVFRAIGIEFRMHLAHPMWCAFFDGAFAISSMLLIVFFGAALGNVLRGVSLGADHYFFAALWTDFRPGSNPGILDWYTILCALLALAALSMHGALYLILKTEGGLNARLRAWVKGLWPAQVALSATALAATLLVRPHLLDNYKNAPVAWTLPLLVVGGLAGIVHFTRNGRERNAFLASSVYLVATLGGAAVALYPALLPSSADPANSITIYNAAAGASSLSIGLIWWGIGMAIAVGYSVVVYTLFKGKVQAGTGYH
jgi:cytochrome d ubiquinol oxidase subunit II